jgi:hypothetical protein
MAQERILLQMNRIIMMIATVGLMVIATGCTSFESNRVGEQVKVDMKVKVEPEIEAGKQLVEGNAKVNCLFGIFNWGVDSQVLGVNYTNNACGSSLFTSPADIARNGAAYKACNKAKADLLLAPRYELTVKDYFVFKTVNCQVKGYPGVLKSIKVKK